MPESSLARGGGKIRIRLKLSVHIRGCSAFVGISVYVCGCLFQSLIFSVYYSQACGVSYLVCVSAFWYSLKYPVRDENCTWRRRVFPEILSSTWITSSDLTVQIQETGGQTVWDRERCVVSLLPQDIYTVPWTSLWMQANCKQYHVSAKVGPLR